MRKGQKASAETRRKISEANRGKKPWHAGLTGVYSTETHRKMSEARLKRKAQLGYINSHEARQKMSEAHRGEKNHNWGKSLSTERRRKNSEAIRGEKNPNWGKKPWNYGKQLSAEARQKISESLRGDKNPNWRRRGEKSPSWKGGITPLHELLRKSAKYAEWRQSVFLRDAFTCRKCENRGGDLHVHHKKSFSMLMQKAKKYLPLFTWHEACLTYSPLWDIDNGIILCVKCHKVLHKRRR